MSLTESLIALRYYTLHICSYQLGNKFPKETILNIWRNEKYFSDLLIYQLFGSQFGQNSVDIIIENNFALNFALIVTKQLINR